MSPVTSILDRSVARSLVEDLRPCASVYVGLDGAEPGTDTAEDLVGCAASPRAWHRAPEASNSAIARHLARRPVAPARTGLRAAARVRFGVPVPDQMDVARWGTGERGATAGLAAEPSSHVVVDDRTGPT
jgi:hypothetical protein